jgi:hypothetical protein
MKLRSFLSVWTVVLLSLSCASEDDVAEQRLKVIHLNPVESGTGMIPDDHPIHLMELAATRYTFRDVDKMYRKYIKNVKGVPYETNLKNAGFRLVMERGLIKYGTPADKEFYLKEQLGVNINLVNFEKFYLLMVDSKRFLGFKKAHEYDLLFYNKNRKEISLFEVEDIVRDEIYTRLDKARLLYQAYD